MKQARQAEEQTALSERVRAANASAEAESATGELQAFAEAVRGSVAVHNRSLGSLNSWVNEANGQFCSFHIQVERGRPVQDNLYDLHRRATEELVNPLIAREISYSALTLNGMGMVHYGPYSIVLKSLPIEDRSTVFEMNCFEFVKRHRIVPGVKAVPAGYRAVWAQRDLLAVAKLQPKVLSGMSGDAFDRLLMEPLGQQSDCDFIEVHIFGELKCESIARVTGPKPETREDRGVWRQTAAKLQRLGVEVVEI